MKKFQAESSKCLKHLVYKFDINKIVAYLKRFSEELSNLYYWDVNIDKLVQLEVLTEIEREKLNGMNPYEKGIRLKEKVGECLNEYYQKNNPKFDKLCLWIIKDWGGIKGAKDENTLDLIIEFLNSNNPKFNRIASSSKVGSFMYPDRNIIYDSRVAYSLNWIILSQNAGDNFFPIPKGRNSKMSAFDMDVLIRLKNVQNYKTTNSEDLNNRLYISHRDSICYIPNNIAYSELNSLATKINRRLWQGERSKSLYYTEMLLFSIADKQVFSDITSRLSLNIC